MKKRLLALLLVLALLITCLPIGAVAEGTETELDNTEQTQTLEETVPQKGDHADDVHKCEHCDQFVTWTKWGNANGKTGTMPNDTDHYILDTDINPTGRVPLKNQDIVICLNGFTITASGTDADKADSLYSFSKDATAKVTITDCTAH